MSRRIFVSSVVVVIALWGLGPGAPGAVSSAPPAPGPHTVEAHHEYVGTGPVLIPGGHITPASGRAIIAVVDSVFDPIGGAVCHSDAVGDPPCVPTGGVLGGHKFCDGLSLHVWPDWDPAKDMWIWLGTPWDQPPGVTPGTHCEKTRPATIGYVYHWPNDEGV